MEANPYTKNLDRLEFMVTLACTGRCRHCSEGDHSGSGEHISGGVGAQAVRSLAAVRTIDSVMTFGGEPLLYPEAVCKIHAAARDCGIPKRQLITNGYFTKDIQKIRDTAAELVWSGVNDILLSGDYSGKRRQKLCRSGKGGEVQRRSNTCTPRVAGERNRRKSLQRQNAGAYRGVRRNGY